MPCPSPLACLNVVNTACIKHHRFLRLGGCLHVGQSKTSLDTRPRAPFFCHSCVCSPAPAFHHTSPFYKRTLTQTNAHTHTHEHLTHTDITHTPIHTQPHTNREWMPWRCLEVRFWVSIANYQSRLCPIYTAALARSTEECSSDEVHTRHLQVIARSLSAYTYNLYIVYIQFIYIYIHFV